MPPAAVSRVSSYDFTASMGLMPIGMAIAGPVAEAERVRGQEQQINAEVERNRAVLDAALTALGGVR